MFRSGRHKTAAESCASLSSEVEHVAVFGRHFGALTD